VESDVFHATKQGTCGTRLLPQMPIFDEEEQNRVRGINFRNFLFFSKIFSGAFDECPEGTYKHAKTIKKKSSESRKQKKNRLPCP